MTGERTLKGNEIKRQYEEDLEVFNRLMHREVPSELANQIAELRKAQRIVSEATAAIVAISDNVEKARREAMRSTMYNDCQKAYDALIAEYGSDDGFEHHRKIKGFYDEKPDAYRHILCKLEDAQSEFKKAKSRLVDSIDAADAILATVHSF